MSYGRFVLGSLVGGAIGAVIGLLVAPRSGEETRSMLQEDLAHKREHSLEYLKDKTKQLETKIKALSEELEQTGRDVLNKMQCSRNDGDRKPQEDPVNT